jgi:hypothetical protein
MPSEREKAFKCARESSWSNVRRHMDRKTSLEFFVDVDSKYTIYVKDWSKAEIGKPAPTLEEVPLTLAIAAAPPSKNPWLEWQPARWVHRGAVSLHNTIRGLVPRQQAMNRLRPALLSQPFKCTALLADADKQPGLSVGHTKR